MNTHSRVGQRGSSLILLIGVIAALALLVSALVVLTSNVMHNTARHRAQARTFNVAEAALDAAQAAAWVNWPLVDTPVPALPGDFEAQFPAPGTALRSHQAKRGRGCPRVASSPTPPPEPRRAPPRRR